MTAQVGTVPAFALNAGEMHVVEDDASRQSEIILVRSVVGTTWEVTRGAEGTTPVVHPSGGNFVQTITAAVLSKFHVSDEGIVNFFGRQNVGSTSEGGELILQGPVGKPDWNMDVYDLTFRLVVGASEKFKVSTTGAVGIDGTAASLIIGATTRPTNDSERLVVYAATGQTQGVIQARDSAGGALFNVQPDGRVLLKSGVLVPDTRAVADAPSAFVSGRGNMVTWEFKNSGTVGLSDGSHVGLQTFAPWGDDSGGGVHQMAYGPSGTVYYRYGTRSGGWGPWRDLSGMRVLTSMSYGPNGYQHDQAYKSGYPQSNTDWWHPINHPTANYGLYGYGIVYRNDGEPGGITWSGDTSSTFTCPASGIIKVTITADSVQPNSQTGMIGFRLTGASTLEPRARYALRLGVNAYGSLMHSGVYVVRGLVAGGSYTIEPYVSAAGNQYVYITSYSYVVEG